MSRVTILQAVLAVLPPNGGPLSAREIHDLIVARSLFTFKTADSLGMVRSAIRRHLRASAPEGAQLSTAGADKYARAQPPKG